MCPQAFSSWQRIPDGGPLCAFLCRRTSNLCSRNQAAFAAAMSLSRVIAFNRIEYMLGCLTCQVSVRFCFRKASLHNFHGLQWPRVLTQRTYNTDLLSKPVNTEDAMQSWTHDSAFAPLGSGLFQVAFSLAVVVYHGRRLSLALQAAISAMVTACVQKQMDSCQSDSMAMPSLAPIFGQASSSQGAA